MTVAFDRKAAMEPLRDTLKAALAETVAMIDPAAPAWDTDWKVRHCAFLRDLLDQYWVRPFDSESVSNP